MPKYPRFTWEAPVTENERWQGSYRKMKMRVMNPLYIEGLP